MTTVVDATKTCSKCKETKPVSAFSPKESRCRACEAARTRARLHGGTDGVEQEQVECSRIRVDGGTQMRARLNQETVAEYAAAMQEIDGWGKFPAVEVYHDGSTYWLADGFHRVAAAVQAGVEAVPAKIHAGDQRKAILHAAGANADHGLRRTNADKRRAVETLLRDEEWRNMTDVDIARACRVDSKTVGNIRRELTSTLEIPMSTVRKTADGRTMNVGNIGRKAEPEQYTIDHVLDNMIWEWVGKHASETQRLPDDVLQFVDEAKTTRADEARSRMSKWLHEMGVEWRIGELPRAVKRVREQRRQRELQATARAVYVEPEPTISKEVDGWILEGAALAHNAARPEKLGGGGDWHKHVMGNLITVPSHDGNFTGALDNATAEELIAALGKIPPEGNKTKRGKIESRLRKIGAVKAPTPVEHITPTDLAAAGYEMVQSQWGWTWRERTGATGDWWPWEQAIEDARKRLGPAPQPAWEPRYDTPLDLKVAGINIEEAEPNYWRFVADPVIYPNREPGALHDTQEQAVASARKVFGIWEESEEDDPLIKRLIYPANGTDSVDAVLAATDEQLQTALAALPPDLVSARGPVLEAQLKRRGVEPIVREAELEDDGIDHAKLARIMAEKTEHARRVREDLDLREPVAQDAFDAWLAAMPPSSGLRECLGILELAKTAAQQARTLDPDLTHFVNNALPTWSQLIHKLERKMR